LSEEKVSSKASRFDDSPDEETEMVKCSPQNPSPVQQSETSKKFERKTTKCSEN
jgi:hypothetical protein